MVNWKTLFNNKTVNLHDPMKNAKSYCSLLKHFYNGKKVPIIPPLLIDNRIISDSEKKKKQTISIIFLPLMAQL